MQKKERGYVNSRRTCKDSDSLPSSNNLISRKSCMKHETGMRSSTSNPCIYFNRRSMCTFFLTRDLIRIKQTWTDVSKTSIWTNSSSFESERVKKEKTTFSEGSYHGLSINWRVKMIRSYWKRLEKWSYDIVDCWWFSKRKDVSEKDVRSRADRWRCSDPSAEMLGDIDCKNGLKRSICTLTTTEDTGRNEEINDGRRHYVWIVFARTCQSKSRQYDFLIITEDTAEFICKGRLRSLTNETDLWTPGHVRRQVDGRYVDNEKDSLTQEIGNDASLGSRTVMTTRLRGVWKCDPFKISRQQNLHNFLTHYSSEVDGVKYFVKMNIRFEHQRRTVSQRRSCTETGSGTWRSACRPLRDHRSKVGPPAFASIWES